MNEIVDQARIDANWRAIQVELDAPRPSILERSLRRLGIPARVTRLVVATPSLRRAWYLAVAVAVVVGLGAAEPGRDASLFTLLVLATTLPLLGVAIAYGPSSDPMYEVQLATPMRGLQLVAIRAATVLAVATLGVGVPALLSPVARPMAFVWLLPALALVVTALAVMTWLPPRRAAALVVVAWLAVIVIVRLAQEDDLAVFGGIGQLASLACALVAGAVLIGRRQAFDRIEVT
jgi:hypothetical protein